MARYVDGYVVAVPKKNLKIYLKMARWGRKTWMKFGALDFHEAMGDDLKTPMGVSFLKLVEAKPGETVFFSWVVFKSKAHRDAVNKKVFDPQFAAEMPKKMPFDVKRMAYGGFKILVEA